VRNLLVRSLYGGFGLGVCVANLDRHLRYAPGESRFGLGPDGLHHGCTEIDADVGGLVRGEKAGLCAFDAAFFSSFFLPIVVSFVWPGRMPARSA
jgi:hypothetical protein